MTLKLALICCLLALTAFRAQPESRALPSGTVLERDAEGIWRIDLATKTRTLFYRFPTNFFTQGEFIDYAEQHLYRVEVPRPIQPSAWYYSVLNLVKIDLISGEKTILYSGQGIGIAPWYPNSKDYILLIKFPRRVSRFTVPEACLLDVKAASCQQIPEDVIRRIFLLDSEVWLDPFSFTTGNRVYNLLTGNSQDTPFPSWAFYQLVPMPSAQQFLAVANPPNKTFETGAGIYILNMDTFQLSERLCDVPPFTNAFLPHLSSDNRLMQYGWENYSDRSTIILDLETCQTVFELDSIYYRTWLPGSHRFLGQMRDKEGNWGNLVVFDADTGHMETVLYRNQYLNLDIVP